MQISKPVVKSRKLFRIVMQERPDISVSTISSVISKFRQGQKQFVFRDSGGDFAIMGKHTRIFTRFLNKQFPKREDQ